MMLLINIAKKKKKLTKLNVILASTRFNKKTTTVVKLFVKASTVYLHILISIFISSGQALYRKKNL